MNKSKDKRVQQFLDELAEFKSNEFEIVQSLRQAVLVSHRHAREEIKYGGIVFIVEHNLFGGVFVSRNHISLEFTNGAQMVDKHKLLEGTGKYRRHLKFTSLSDVKLKQVDYYIKQAIVD